MHRLTLVQIDGIDQLQAQETDDQGNLVALHDLDGEGDSSPHRFGNCSWTRIGQLQPEFEGDYFWAALDTICKEATALGYDVPETA